MSVPTDIAPGDVALDRPQTVQETIAPADPNAALNARHLVKRAAEQKAAGDRARAARGETVEPRNVARILGILEICACGRRPNVAGYSKDGSMCRICEQILADTTTS